MIKSTLTALLFLCCASISSATSFTIKHNGMRGTEGGGYTGIFFNLNQLNQNTVKVSTTASDGRTSKSIAALPCEQVYLQSITLNSRGGYSGYMNTFDQLGYAVVMGDDFDVTLAILNHKSLLVKKDFTKKSSSLTINLRQLKIKVKDTHKIDFYDRKKVPLRLQLHATEEAEPFLNTPIAGYRTNKTPNSNGFIPSGIQIICSDSPIK